MRMSDAGDFTERELSRNESGAIRWVVAAERAGGRLASAGWLDKQGGPWELTGPGAKAFLTLSEDEFHTEMLRLDAVALGHRPDGDSDA